mmetsp:Transcript_44191/g.102048  ORF Transcript_44191/g.102048 Transcript_44191/m.102048 type:complete len:185 (-) Transcript_44191:146-700(-)
MAAEGVETPAVSDERKANEVPAAGDDGSDSDDGLPPMSSYWSLSLNVTKVAEPTAPSKLKQGMDKPLGKGKGRSSGKGKGKSSGQTSGKGKGKFHGKKGKRMFRSDDVDSFVAWAQDPDADDGRRDVSRSPRLQKEKERLEKFMHWARDDVEVKDEETQELDDSEMNVGMNQFIEWALDDDKFE